MVGGTFNPQTNYLFKNPRSVIHIFTLLPYLSESQQNELLDIFIVLLEECTADAAMCNKVRLIEKIVSLLENENTLKLLSTNVQNKLVYLIGILGSLTIEVRELKGL